jgi:glutathione S-transferase
VNEPWLRWKTGQWSGRITVPVMFDSNGLVLKDSLDIAKYSDSVGTNEQKLFPDHLVSEIETWNNRMEELGAALRVTGMHRIETDEEVKKDLVPGWMNSVGFVSNYMFGSIRNYMTSKYPIENAESIIKQILDELDNQIKDKDYILDNQFTYADITVASALQGMYPVDNSIWKLKDGERKMLTDPIYQEYPRILEWRDKVVTKHFTIPNIDEL